MCVCLCVAVGVEKNGLTRGRTHSDFMLSLPLLRWADFFFSPRQKLWFSNRCTCSLRSPNTIIRSTSLLAPSNFMKMCVGFPWSCMFRLVTEPFSFILKLNSYKYQWKGPDDYVSSPEQVFMGVLGSQTDTGDCGVSSFDIQDQVSGAEVEFIWNVRMPEAWAHLHQTFLETRCLHAVKAFSCPATCYCCLTSLFQINFDWWRFFFFLITKKFPSLN